MKTIIYILLLLITGFNLVGQNSFSKENLKNNSVSHVIQSAFIENKGQIRDIDGNPVPSVLFEYTNSNQTIWITEKGITLQTNKIEYETENSLTRSESYFPGYQKEKKFKVHWERIDIELKNSTIHKNNIIKENQSQGYRNYFYTHCAEGIYEVKSYNRIIIKNVYKGIDWVLSCNFDAYPNNNSVQSTQKPQFKYDFIVHPNADYKQIQLLYKSKSPITLNSDGSLNLFTSYGRITENKPISFYKKQKVFTRFVQNYQKQIRLGQETGYETAISFDFDRSFSAKNRTESLIIDPYYLWSTYYGGSGNDSFMSVDSDGSGNIFVTGYSNSGATFPLQNAGTFFQGTIGGDYDVVIIKFDNLGALLWATYYGSTAEDRGMSIVTNPSGEIYVTGYTASAGFPTMNLPGAYNQAMYGGNIDAFILKFSNTGVRQWATFYGGAFEDRANTAFFDGIHLFIVGYTLSVGTFPLQNLAGAYNQTMHGGLSDIFILRFNDSGVCQWSTFYGGTGIESASAVTVDVINHKLYVVGSTSGTFPLQNLAGAYNQTTYGGGTSDAFILRFDRFTGVVEWASYYGGSDIDAAFSVITSLNGDVYVSGGTLSTNLPTQFLMGAHNQATNGGGYDAFIIRFELSGNCLWAAYVGDVGNQYNPANASFDNLAILPCSSNVLVMTFDTDASINYGSFFLGLACVDFRPYPYDQWNSTTYQGGIDVGFAFFYLNTNAGIVASYIGGTGNDYRSAMCVDNIGDLFIVGQTSSMAGFTTGTRLGGTSYLDNTYDGGEDAYIHRTQPCSCFGGVALPIENINITASCQEKSTYLQWQNNQNNHFIIERSLDGITWKEIGISETTKEYYVDQNIENNTNYYYRLKQVDKDGNYRYSKIVTSSCEIEQDIILYPNPAQEMIYIQTNGNSVNYISVYDNIGKLVLSKYISPSDNLTGQILLDVSHLSKGIYIVQIATNTGFVNKKVVR